MGTTRKGAAGVIAAVMLACAPANVAAEQVIGEVVATIDGEPREWRTLGPDGTGIQYNTSLQAFGPMQTVSVMGFPPGRAGMRGTIQLTFALMSGGLDTFEQELIYAPEGMSRMWVSLEGEDLITIEEFENRAEGAVVSGRFSGRVCLQESLFAQPDQANCKPVEGRFSTSLPALAG